MNTILKEWLVKTIMELEEERDAMPGAVNEDAAMALAAMKLALASLEAEPVSEVCEGFTLRYIGHGPAPKSGVRIGDRLYASPPAPVAMKDHQIRELVNELRDIAVKYHGSQQLREHIARTIRAAMLQGADGNSPAIPDGWTGSDEANAALIMLDRIETVDSVDDDRIEGIKRIIRALAAAPKQEVK